MNVKVLVAHHKEGYLYMDTIHVPIQVGKSLSDMDLGILGDNIGDNISNLNPFYCELTATYWAWKNIESDYIGICHYRRYFSNVEFFPKFLNFSKFKFNIIKIKNWITRNRIAKAVFLNNFIIKNNDKEQYLREFSGWLEKDICKSETEIYALKSVEYTNMTNLEHFSSLGVEYITQLGVIISENYPEYHKVLNSSLASNKLHCANMIIMKNNIFNEYCSFIFDVLKLHATMNVLDDRYSRVPGYMAELLTNTFILKKQNEKVNVKFLKTMYIE